MLSDRFRPFLRDRFRPSRRMDIGTKLVRSPCFTLAHYSTQSNRCIDAVGQKLIGANRRGLQGNGDAINDCRYSGLMCSTSLSVSGGGGGSAASSSVIVGYVFSNCSLLDLGIRGKPLVGFFEVFTHQLRFGNEKGFQLSAHFARHRFCRPISNRSAPRTV